MTRIGNMLRKEIVNDSTISANLNNLYQGEIPDDAQTPAGKWQRISRTGDSSLDAATGMATARIQIDIYAERHNDAQQIAEDIRKKFAPWKNRVLGWDPGIKVHRIHAEDIRDEQTDINTDERRRRIDFMITYQENL